MTDDRRTSIDGDQITNHTITPDEFNTVDSVTDPKAWQILMWDKVNQKMKWFYIVIFYYIQTIYTFGHLKWDKIL